MASSSSWSCQKILFLVVGLSFLFFTYGPVLQNSTANAQHHFDPFRICQFDQIYNLGDSISDTGNLVRESAIGAATPFAKLPYGQTFFNNATGRCSNGRLMVDYIAMAAHVPFIRPYKDIDSDFRHGVNFAVAGSTALSSQMLMTKNIISPVTPSSLGVQLQWMSKYFNSICLNNQDCVGKLSTALFMVDESGGNDYNYAIFQGKTMEELKSMVPEVVGMIIHAVKMVLEFGAKKVIVPGNFPMGCLPIYQTTFKSNVSEAYDENHCVKELNDFSKYHNEQLQQALHKLRQAKPNAIIVYGDYYDTYQFLLRYAKHHGFDTQKACCGSGGEFNFNMIKMCGALGVPVCEDPYKHVHWDGVHLTENSYSIMTGWLLHDIFKKLQCHFL